MNNNSFISKTLKTFITSLVVSVFIFGSLYFFLSDNTPSTETKPKEVKSATTEKSKKLVVDEEPVTNTEPSNPDLTYDATREAKKAEKVDTLVAKQNSPERQVLGAKTESLIAQIPGATDYTSPYQNETSPATPATTPTAAITGTLPAALTMASTTVYATGVPKTGNESLYIVLGIFSTIAGFLIVNGKSFAMSNFERI